MNELKQIFGTGEDLSALQMGTRAFVIFLLGIVLVRIAGRRAFGVGEPFDNVFTILIGAILSRAVVGASPFIPVIASALVIVLMHLLFGKLSVYSQLFGKIVKGEVITLFENGSMIKKNMARCNISEKDLMEGVRANGNLESLDEVKKVFIERDGKISVIKKNI